MILSTLKCAFLYFFQIITLYGWTLGNDGFQKYQEYTERWNERSKVENFIKALPTDEKLTDSQKKDLIELMYKERKDVFTELSYDPSGLKELTSEINERIAKRMEIKEQIDERILTKAGSILSSSQLEQFKKYLKNQI